VELAESRVALDLVSLKKGRDLVTPSDVASANQALQNDLLELAARCAPPRRPHFSRQQVTPRMASFPK
jgi:hypothetical protein